MSDLQAVADRVEIEALRGEFTDAVMMRDYDRFASLFTEDGAWRIMGGPRVYTVAELIRAYLRAVGGRRPILPIRMPGRAARAVREGANLAPEHAVGKRTWEEFLAERVPA